MNYLPEFLKHIDQADSTIYRGHADRSWVLKPSIGRNFGSDWSIVLEHEKNSLVEFKKSIPYLKHKPELDIEWLALMQHHGLSTRLLDFTTNPLIALFFASDPTVRKDGEFIIARYSRIYDEAPWDDIFQSKNSFAYYPPHITERIIGQSGCFVFSNKPNQELAGKQIERKVIKKDDKQVVRRELQQLGISYGSLFPGIDGVCQDLNEELEWNIIDSQIPF